MTEAARLKQNAYQRAYYKRTRGRKPLGERNLKVAKSGDRIDDAISQLSSVIGILRVVRALPATSQKAVAAALNATIDK